MAPPPPNRPPKAHQHEWTNDVLTKSLKLVYGYRSKALHEAIPFPLPMCEPPFLSRDMEVSAEVPHGEATSARGAVWMRKDTPLHLHVFEYIVRHALIEWLQQFQLEES